VSERYLREHYFGVFASLLFGLCMAYLLEKTN